MDKHKTNNLKSQWTMQLSLLCIFFVTVLFLAMIGYFGGKLKPTHWLMYNYLIVVAYFLIIHIANVRWQKFSDRSFAINLFIWAWLARIGAMVVLLFIAEFTWNQPEYVGAVDALTHNWQAGEFAEVLRSGNFSRIIPTLQSFYESPDNWGVPIVIGIVYAVLGSHAIIGKLFITLLGAGTTLLIYKTARLVWDESTARLAGILWAFFPLSLFFSAVILKEEFVVFLVMLAIYSFVRIMTKKLLDIKFIFIIALSVAAIFYFRVVAGAVLISSIAMGFILNKYRGSFFISISYGFFLLSLIVVVVHLFGYSEVYTDRILSFERVIEQRLTSVSQVQTLANIVGLPIYLIISFIAPFPSMVFTPLRFELGHDSNYYFISGLIIWVFLVYYGLIGIWRAINDKFGKSGPIWTYVLFYTLALGLTALFTRVRFGYNIMPMFFILIAVGVSYRHEYPRLAFYLPFAVLLIMAWNIFRLAGRGII